MYNGNSRFEQLANGLVTELISFQTQLFYDPTTQVARAIFNGGTYMSVTDPVDESIQYMQVGQHTDILHVDLMDKLADIPCVAGDVDPVTGAPLDNISVYGMQIMMKRSYDKYHNQREQERLAAIAEAEALAAAEAEAAAAAAAAQEEQAALEQDPTTDPEPTP